MKRLNAVTPKIRQDINEHFCGIQDHAFKR